MPKTFCDDVWGWQRKGIAKFSGFNYDLTPECREWLQTNISKDDWWWDHFTDEGEVEIYFVNPNDAMLFKLTWL